MTWSTRRQLIIIGIVTAVVVFLIALPTFFFIYKPPTCSDEKKNQGEFGVDCGGPCALVCEAEALQPIVRWQRVFRVAPEVFSAVAYIENPNLDSEAFDVPYSFRLYDMENVLVYEKTGTVYIPPRKVFGLFEDGFLVGKRTPVRALFEFTAPASWTKTTVAEPDLRIVNRVLSREESTPRITAGLHNRTLRGVSNIEVVALVFDEEGNAIGSSRTIVDYVEKGETHPLVFTWRDPFPAPVAKTELIFRVIPD